MALDGSVTVRMRPVGGKPSATADPLEQQPSRSNYFIGNDPQKMAQSTAGNAFVTKVGGQGPLIYSTYLRGSAGKMVNFLAAIGP